MTAGPSAHHDPDGYVHSVSPSRRSSSIAKIRGRVRGVGSEFVLALRYALRIAREHGPGSGSKLGRECIPAAVGPKRLPQLVGRGRALEIVLGANDFDGETAERYGYGQSGTSGRSAGRLRRRARANESPPSTAPDRGSEKPHQSSLAAVRRSPTRRAQLFTTALTWPESQRRFQALRDRGSTSRAKMEKPVRRASRDTSRYVECRLWLRETLRVGGHRSALRRLP